jgi:hypothetical protein
LTEDNLKRNDAS